MPPLPSTCVSAPYLPRRHKTQPTPANHISSPQSRR
ncbi:hypothetical protein E2C01_089339 [Portunus trituberculatus]|uniref:Uncharacterized protein n=1 Tax=Portunus trituberculatus TaxID=210409 RepID=A0A5B7JIJ5_PORTR|nr:hypothetical protein [Portunus trituberculatus]